MTGLGMREREALLAAIRRATLVVKAATPEGRFESAMARLGKLLHARRLERRHNPNWPSQPRVPRGNADGGQWTDGGASGGEELAPSEFEEVVAGELTGARQLTVGGASLYVVDLLEEEAKGGHTIAAHVGRSPESLLARVRGERCFGLVVSVIVRRAGSFPTLAAAQKLVNSTLAQNRRTVDMVASGQEPDGFLIATFRSKTGIEAYRDTENSNPRLRDTDGVGVYIIHDPTSPKGYRVHTAYPRQD